MRSLQGWLEWLSGTPGDGAGDDLPREGWTRFRMSDGIAFVVHVPLSEFIPGWRLALLEDRLIEIRNPQGRRRNCNPHQIVYAENFDATSVAPTVTVSAPADGLAQPAV